MAGVNLPTFQQVQEEILATHLDEHSPIFQQLNQYLYHVNRIAALLERVGENYHHRRWSLASKRAKKDRVYRNIHRRALQVLRLLVILFRMNSARRLMDRVNPFPGLIPSLHSPQRYYLKQVNNHWLEAGPPPQWNMAFEDLKYFLPLLEGNDLETALGVVGQPVRPSARRTFADPIYELHNSRFYKQMLNIRRGTVVLWNWLKQLARCRDESPRAEVIYYLIGHWFHSVVFHFAPDREAPDFAPRFFEFVNQDPAPFQNAIMNILPTWQGGQLVSDYLYTDSVQMDMDSLSSGELYDQLIEPALVDCSRSLRGMRHTQRRFQNWFWRPAQEGSDGTFDLNTAGQGVLSRLNDFRSSINH